MSSKKTTSKDLLRLEKNYFPNIYHEDNFKDEKEFALNKIMKQSITKPKMFEIPKKTEIFDRIHTFLPSFISSTNELLNDKEKLQQQKIEKTKDEKINLRRIKESPGKYIYKTNVDPKNKDIELNLLMGVFDVKDDNILPSLEAKSLEPILDLD